jgi:hypothetical protein
MLSFFQQMLRLRKSRAKKITRKGPHEQRVPLDQASAVSEALTRDEARRNAVNIAKLPALLGK